MDDQIDFAKEILEFGLELAQEARDNILLSRSLIMLAHYYRLKGQLDIALDSYRQSIELKNVPHLLLAYPIRHIGQILQTRGELEIARMCYQKSLKLFDFVSNDLGVARTLQAGRFRETRPATGAPMLAGVGGARRSDCR